MGSLRGHRRGIVAVLLLASVVLAGCSGSKSNSANDKKPTGPAGPAEVDADSGGIEGIVLDETSTVLTGATVGIASEGLETRSDSEGKFSLSKVKPGTHQLQATLIGYSTEVKAVEVVAGEVTNDITFQLTQVSIANESYSVHEQQTGFLACGTGTYVLTQVACGALDTKQAFLFQYDIEPEMSGVLWEQIWEPTQVLSKDLVMILEADGCGLDCPEASTFASVGGCCLLRVALAAEQLDIPNVKAHTDGATIQSRTFPAVNSTDMLPTVFTSQAFDIYVEYFYGALPEDFGTTRTNVSQG